MYVYHYVVLCTHMRYMYVCVKYMYMCIFIELIKFIKM